MASANSGAIQLRLHRFIEDRTKMLASIGHDLRTLLTSLRLRAEFIQDAETQQKMLSTLGEITAMTEAAIGYAKENSLSEPTRPMNITALVESLCEDLAPLGLDVTFTGEEKVTLNCRPDALRRAIRNLVENAVRYGHRARVTVTDDESQLIISIEDDGDGIPVAEQEQVFMPFYRLEQSRNRNTGEIGLGLSIAREVARQHGGDVVLTNLERGLRAQVKLPKS